MNENNAHFGTKRAGIYRFDKFSTFNFIISIGLINLSLCNFKIQRFVIFRALVHCKSITTIVPRGLFVTALQ